MHQSRILTVACAAGLLAAIACGDDSTDNSGATSFTATLAATNEVPANTSTATGTATMTVSGNSITYTINVANIQHAILAHIHVAPVGVNGPVELNFCGTGAPLPDCVSGTGVLATGTNGTIAGTITFDSLLSAMRTGGAYVNVHTNDESCGGATGTPGCNPAGEIRGQIVAAN